MYKRTLFKYQINYFDFLEKTKQKKTQNSQKNVEHIQVVVVMDHYPLSTEF